ncbi:hypothetical protein BE08_39805 [Sorangium cellulosum]|uniref:Uncharacterized protein n=1 Tax=Sorangium cellulosum TaxID=56 RepID=A0A150PUD0_SORCE|nr:hypothetical protein BE08_39805 [Sorangium cellulosum]
MNGTAMSRRRAALLLAAAAAHVVVICLGALHVHIGDEGWARRAVKYYGLLSGADSGYSFFAPGVGSTLSASFQVNGPDGNIAADVLETGVSREADIRVRNIIGMFRLEEDPRVRRSLVASWAGKVLARHPDADSVVVQLDTFELPSMAEYREGKTAGWKLDYRAKFMRRAELLRAQQSNGVVP